MTTAADLEPRTHVYVLDANLVTPASAFATMAPGHEAQLREDVAPVWGVGNGDTVSPTPVGASEGVPAGVTQIRVHATTPAADAGSGAEAEHDPDENIDVFEDMLLQFGIGPETPTIEDAISAAISHELIEYRNDPTCDRTATLLDDRVVAVEACDQVQAQTYRKLSVCVSNFNTQSNFNLGAAPTLAPFDFLGMQTAQFQVEPGGYEQVLDPSAGWQMITALHYADGSTISPETTIPLYENGIPSRAHIDAMPNGMLRYRAELAYRGLGRHAKRKRRHARSLAEYRKALERDAPTPE